MLTGNAVPAPVWANTHVEADSLVGWLWADSSTCAPSINNTASNAKKRAGVLMLVGRVCGIYEH